MDQLTYQCHLKLSHPIEVKVWKEPYPAIYKFMQCQDVVRNALKSSPNSDSNALWSNSSIGCNIQYDQFGNTKQVLNGIQNDNEDRIHHDLKSQSFILTFILHASSKTHGRWSKVQKNMPRSIFNFTTKYLHNTLATRKNLVSVFDSCLPLLLPVGNPSRLFIKLQVLTGRW